MEKFLIRKRKGEDESSLDISEQNSSDAAIVPESKKRKNDQFQEKWHKLYDWLEIEKKNEVIYMFCKFCRKCKKKNPFAKGKN
jgi:hypothetical protein